MTYENCEHEWESGNEIRICLLCGQVRTFPRDDKLQPKIIWQGRDSKQDPMELSATDKAIIAHLAKDKGVKTVAGGTQIPMHVIRAWVGAYCRKPKETVSIPEETQETPAPKTKRRYTKRRSRPYWKKKREEVMADYNSMNLVDFFKTWRLSSNTWKTIRDLLEIPKKSMALGKEARLPKPKITPTAGTLPVFPAFNDSWGVAAQVEWFKSYLELKKLEVK